MKKHIIIKNNKGKKWMFPNDSDRIATNIYQPSSIKGKIMKFIVPTISHLDGNNLIFKIFKNIYVCDYKTDESIKNNIERILCEYNDDFTYSYFFGTPSADQKTTIQISVENQVVGYCKITDNTRLAEIFKNEQKNLNYFHSCGIDNIPNCLYCEQYKDGNWMFLQDTKKNKSSKIIENINNVVTDFIKIFCDKTQVKLSYKESDYYKDLFYLKASIIKKTFLKEYFYLLDNEIQTVEKYFNDVECFSAYHGDFTSWNCFENNGELFVYDFEYAKTSYPKYLDLFHYFTQTCIYTKKLDSKQIVKKFQKKIVLFDNFFEDPIFSYKLYLLSVISLYLSREKNECPLDIQDTILTWCEIISLL